MVSQKVSPAVWKVSLIVVLGIALIPLGGMAQNDTLVIGLQDVTATLDPAKVPDVSSRAITKQLYESLVDFKEDNFTQPIPELAESWDIGEDGKTWTFHLRTGTTFASGNPITADAVVFSLTRAVKIKGRPSWLLTQFGLTEETITKVDDTAVQLVLNKQYAPALVLACLAHSVASILDPAVMEHEQEGDMGSAWLDTHSAGSGMFVLAERIPGESFTLAANPNYQGTKPSVANVAVKNIADPFEQAILLEKGDIDVAWDLQPAEVKRLETNPEIEIYNSPTFKLRFLGMNLGYEPLSNSSVRDAIRYAIDYDGIVDFILEGAAVKLQTFIPKGLLGYNPGMPYTTDLEKARQLLADAGYADGFEVELLALDRSPWVDLAAQIKSDLKRIGITVNVKELPPPEALKLVFSRNTQLFLLGLEPDYADPDALAKYFAHCDSVGDDATVKLLAWFVNYLNPEISALVEQAARELDQNAREATYKEITEIILQDGPYAVLYTELKQYGVRTDARDIIGIPSYFQSGFPTLR